MSFTHPTGDLGTDIGEGHNVVYGEIEHIVAKGTRTHTCVHTGTLTHTNFDPDAARAHGGNGQGCECTVCACVCVSSV